MVHETKFSLNISYSTHVCLAQLDQHQTCKSVMVSVVSSSPTRGSLILYENDRDVRFVLFTRTSIVYCYVNWWPMRTYVLYTVVFGHHLHSTQEKELKQSQLQSELVRIIRMPTLGIGASRCNYLPSSKSIHLT